MISLLRQPNPELWVPVTASHTAFVLATISVAIEIA